jgi:hypothetical protein
MHSHLDNRDMFERSFDRPKDFFKLIPEEQWAIDKRLGILDWDGSALTPEQLERFHKHYNEPTSIS